MAISGKLFSTNNFSDILFHITQMPKINLAAQTAIRAVAFLLENAAEEESADKIAKLILTAIMPHNSDTDHQSIHRAAQNAIKARQILIDLPPNSQLGPGKVSHAQLTLKVKQALKSIVKEDSPELETHAITQTRNEAIITKMLTQQAAEYLKTSHIKNKFTNILNQKAIIKERTYPVIIQFTPITYNPNSKEQI
ncbi:hypothetical protein BDR06DRAFT_1004133 [Suillus hirtellus]|nr:hypothetical protein BDR06DRAFT_1004133 [Suillus hirtellus]